MPDGAIYAGTSPETNKPMYTAFVDAPMTYAFNEARAYSKKMDAHGHQDWRLLTKAELNVLSKNRVAIGGFNLTGSYPGGWYWSASQKLRWGAWAQRFSDGLASRKISHREWFSSMKTRVLRSHPATGAQAEKSPLQIGIRTSSRLRPVGPMPGTRARKIPMRRRNGLDGDGSGRGT
jgi:hypothetical protein